MLPNKSLVSHPYPKNCPNLLKIMIAIELYSFHKTAFWVYVPNLGFFSLSLQIYLWLYL